MQIGECADVGVSYLFTSKLNTQDYFLLKSPTGPRLKVTFSVRLAGCYANRPDSLQCCQHSKHPVAVEGLTLRYQLDAFRSLDLSTHCGRTVPARGASGLAVCVCPAPNFESRPPRDVPFRGSPGSAPLPAAGVWPLLAADQSELTVAGHATPR